MINEGPLYMKLGTSEGNNFEKRAHMSFVQQSKKCRNHRGINLLPVLHLLLNYLWWSSKSDILLSCFSRLLTCQTPNFSLTWFCNLLRGLRCTFSLYADVVLLLLLAKDFTYYNTSLWGFVISNLILSGGFSLCLLSIRLLRIPDAVLFTSEL